MKVPRNKLRGMRIAVLINLRKCSYLNIFAVRRVVLACPKQYSYNCPFHPTWNASNNQGNSSMDWQLIKENSSMDWQPEWDKDPISQEDYLQMTSYVYQIYKHGLDTMPENALTLLKTHVAGQAVSLEGKSALNRMGVWDDLEMGRCLHRWLSLDMP
jgi:hypothetical protein